MTVRTKIVWSTGLIVVSGALICACAIVEDRHQRQQAEQLLTILRQIHVGTTDRATVVQMTHSFSRYVDEVPAGEQLRFVFFNKWLRRLRLAPHTQFRITIAFDGGVVTDKRAYEIVSTTGCAAEVVERKRGSGITSGFPLPPNHRVLAWPSASAGTVTRIRIENDDTYGEKDRQNDWEFDLSCMTRVGGGCRDARLMLPNALNLLKG